jgi:hypothetical protein
MRSRTFRDRPPGQKAWIAVVIAISLVIVAFAERDINRTPAERIRGPKLFWRIVCTNVSGALVYRRWGRRRSESRDLIAG